MKKMFELLACVVLTACSGGGGGSVDILIPVSMTGIVATGTPVAGAAVTVLCGSGKRETTSRDNGTYFVGVEGCPGPFVITASGVMGNTQDTLVSLNPSNPPPRFCPSNGPCTAELEIIGASVSPFTHAIAAVVSSTGDPFDLVRNFQLEKNSISVGADTDIRTALAAALANVGNAAGALFLGRFVFDPIGGPGGFWSADGTGWDRVLDNVKVEVGSGGITLTNIAAAKVDDMAAVANGSAAPALPANSQVSFNRTNFKTALATPLAGVAEDNGMIDSARTALNACFAVGLGSRGTFAAPGSACANLATPDYLNDGKSGSAEFDALLTDAKMDGAKFGKPEVLRFFTSQRALVKLNAVRTDGIAVSLRSVAENSAATGNSWKLRGNQRPYFMAVNGVAERRIQLTRTGATPSSYSSGLNLYFDLKAGGANDTSAGTATGVSYVLVKGPGLAAGGQVMRPGPSGCDEFMVPATSLPPTALPGTQPCTSYIKLASKALDGSAADPNAGAFGTAPDFTTAAVSDAFILTTIQPMAAYTFEVHQANGTVLTFVERLRARPPTLAELDSVRWNLLSDGTQSALVPGTSSSFSGGANSGLVLSWVTQANTPPVGAALVEIRTDATTAPVRARQSVALPAIPPSTFNSVTIFNGTTGFPAVSNTAGGFQSVQLQSRNRSGLQILSSWVY